MSLTPFEAALGRTQGRIRPDGATPSDGSWMLVLGSDLDGVVADGLEAGDYHEASQSLDVTGIELIRVGQLELRDPGDAAAALLAWEASLLIDGSAVSTMRAYAGRSRTISDMVANVSGLSGVHVITLRLSLVNA